MTKRKGRTPPLRPAEYLSYYKYGIQPGGQNADPSIGFSKVPVWDERTSDEHVHRGVDHNPQELYLTHPAQTLVSQCSNKSLVAEHTQSAQRYFEDENDEKPEQANFRTGLLFNCSQDEEDERGVRSVLWRPWGFTFTTLLSLKSETIRYKHIVQVNSHPPSIENSHHAQRSSSLVIAMASGHTPSGKMLPNFLTMSFEMVTVRVGEADAAVDIPVYRDHLSAVSPYFRGAFEGSFKEATDRNLSLTDVSEQTFRMFLQWANIQVNSQSGGDSMTAPEPLLPKLTTKFANKTITAPAIDEKGYFDGVDMDESCGKNLEWQGDYHLLRSSFLRLYAFADKYNIPQFRDDILTALISQSRTWEWLSNPDQDLIELAYANLPQTSTFIQFLVLSAAIFHVDPLCKDPTRLLHELKKIHIDFAFEVAVVQVAIYRDEVFKKKNKHTARSLWEEALPNSCFLHEHRVQDEKQCRERIRNHPYIFNALIDACTQDALGMKERCNEA